MSAVDLAIRQCRVTETTSVAVLTDGDVGLRAVQQQVAPEVHSGRKVQLDRQMKNFSQWEKKRTGCIVEHAFEVKRKFRLKALGAASKKS